MKKDRTIQHYHIFNLTERKILSFPAGAVYYSYTFILTRKLYNEVETMLNERTDLKKQPDVSILSPNEWDWITYVGMLGKIHYVSISDKVYNDPDFRELILEHLF